MIYKRHSLHLMYRKITFVLAQDITLMDAI